ncbi:condensation domain-containing protein, partial [Mesorhizobium mediterraneum]|uniref:condensation domain-containing protein n=1 Tax=Mesorhizobium mediterraneum TaxID=43617 RepID=UPI001FEED699
MSFAQQRLWLLQQIEPGNPAYNLVGGLHVLGDLDEAAMERSLRALMERHETLRTRFGEGEDGPRQIIEPSARVTLRRRSIGSFDEVADVAAEEGRVPFDLGTEQPVRALLLRLAPQEHVVILILHHIACDAWSLGVLLRDWCEFYNAACERRAPALAPLPVQYADYAVWQREWVQKAALPTQVGYWRERLAGLEP